MKQILTTIWGCIMILSASAQVPLQLSTTKTTSLVFPFTVRHTDSGTSDVLVQAVKGSENILLVKAANKNFAETNLSVVTSDGSVYSFKVVYNEQPDKWVFHLPAQQGSTVESYARSVMDNPRSIRGPEDIKWDMRARVQGLYIKDDVLYIQLLLCNRSMIDYDIELLKFFISDKKKMKRTAIQENELDPIHIAGNTKEVKACAFSMIVVAFDKFTIPDAKRFTIQIMEKNGGRHFQLHLGNNKIVSAIPLPDIK